MKAWTNAITSLTLICYIAVSSIAAAHAFSPSLPKTGASPASMDTSLQEMSPKCHEQVDDAQAKAVSACKIFCAAMSNIIIDEIAVTLLSNQISTESAFLQKDVSKLALAMELHPPK